TVTGFINTDDLSVMKNQMHALTGIDLGSVHTEGDSIPGYAFKTSILSLILPSTLTSLGDHALEGCSFLTSLTIPPSVTSIGKWAFAGCSGLPSIQLPDSLLTIGMQAFAACTGMNTITIPDRVTSLDYQAFAGCSWLDSVSIGSSVTTIGTYAFAGCSNLKSITIPPLVDSIAPQAFVSCLALTSVVIHSTGETIIGEYAFAGNPAITSVIIGPSRGISIGRGAFVSSSALKTLKMASSSVTSIGEDCFQNSAIDTLVMPSSLTSIGTNAFGNCISLKSLTFLPSSGVSIGHYAFGSSTGLKTVKMASPSVTSIGEACFVGSAIDTLVMPSSLTSIGNNAFRNCSNLKSLTFLPSSGVSIGEYAFGDCSNLAFLNMQSPSVDSIGKNCFINCQNLTFLSLPSSLAYIGDYAFRNCNITGSLIMSASLTYIGEYAFFNNQGIDSLTFLPSPGTTIGNYAFSYCDGLVSVRMFSPSVDTIGWVSFGDCRNLSGLILPSSLASISPGAFGSCYGLQDIRINCMVPPLIPQANNVFNYVSTGGIDLYVPSGTKDAYAAAETWSKFHIIEYDLHLSVSADTIAIADTTGSTAAFDIHSSVNWNISSDQPWLVINPVLGMDTASISLMAETNQDTIAREAIIRISGENVSTQTVLVRQAPKPALSVSASELGIGPLAGSAAEFNLGSNQDWIIESGQAWLTVSPSSGNGNTTIILTAEANPDTTARKAILTVKTGRLMPQTIVITQSPQLFLSVLPDVLELGPQSGDTASFHIVSNTGWAVQSDQVWLSLSPLSGSGNEEITVIAEVNINTILREATITIVADGLPGQQVVVKQEPALPSGLLEISQETVVVYPNPVKDVLHINGAAGHSMILYDLQGQVILSRRLSSDHEQIDLSSLPRGVYAIKTGNKTLKIVK
ncbi:MAG: leucine-rich repeat protein, partial [Bacteroidales bacterium]|nr:leucine-rich repeat protein [Bacteroidales bacterium]